MIISLNTAGYFWGGYVIGGVGWPVMIDGLDDGFFPNLYLCWGWEAPFQFPAIFLSSWATHMYIHTYIYICKYTYIRSSSPNLSDWYLQTSFETKSTQVICRVLLKKNNPVDILNPWRSYTTTTTVFSRLKLLKTRESSKQWFLNLGGLRKSIRQRFPGLDVKVSVKVSYEK